MASGAQYPVEHVGVFTPKSQNRDTLFAGEVGFVIAGIKELTAAKVGDTITHATRPATEPLPGFKEAKPQVFAGLYPVEANQYDALRESLEKLKLNDASLQYEPERLEREFGMDLITTAPTVVYQVLMQDGSMVMVENPAKMPEPSKIAEIREPIVTVNLYMPQDYVGAVITLCTSKRGNQVNMAYHGRQVQLTYEIPMAEIVLDFFDRLKSISRGYASMDYEFKEHRASDVVKVDMLINGDKVDALSVIVHRSQSQYRGRGVAAKMREIIPRQMYDVAIQAAIGAHIIARENIKALRKNVLAKCYGGDITRKKKLLEKQKEGKRRMKQVGSVEIPQEAFLAILKNGISMNFALILFILVVLTGIAWVADKLVFLPQRRRAADAAVAEFDRQQQRVDERFRDENAAHVRATLREQRLRQPWWLEYSASFFPVILLVFVLRSFIVEPFKIPSGSMVPTLLVGDFILVNKYDYGIRLPIIDKKIISNRDPQRGDVVVFRYPKDGSIDYIKRVVGVPGDAVAYQDKHLTINGEAVPESPMPDYLDEDRLSMGQSAKYVRQYSETLGGKRHALLNDPAVPPFVIGADDYPYRDNCHYNDRGVMCKVPPGHYFVMGDNRDNSADSRYWGFVPDRNLVGRAFFVWLNFSNLKRVGSFE
ncbi:hypothetical protein DFQ30_010132 [Apophysomyces sp. BC1015]|nr:hypothetical protein DFQ30_010132 [Apophysomyces sp. BC1015]